MQFTRSNRVLPLIVAMGLVLAACGVGNGQDPDQTQDGGQTPFYEGETIEVFVDRDAGGAQTLIGQFMMEHLADYIEGNPRILVRNMPGGTGVVAHNWLYAEAPSDGTALGWFLPGLHYQTYFLGDPAELGLEAEIDEFIPVAGVQNTNVYYVRSDVGSGIDGPADVKDAGSFAVGGQDVNNTKDISIRAILDLAGIDYEYVTGYQEAADAWAAVLRDEVQLHSSGFEGHYIEVVLPAGVEEGIVTPIFYDGTRDLPGVEPAVSAAEFIEMHGGEAEGILWDLYQTNISWRVLNFPPDVPEAAVEAIEEAFAEMLQDPDFREAYRTQYGVDPDAWVVGRDELAQVVDAYRNADPDLGQFREDYVAEVQ